MLCLHCRRLGGGLSVSEILSHGLHDFRRTALPSCERYGLELHALGTQVWHVHFFRIVHNLTNPENSKRVYTTQQFVDWFAREQVSLPKSTLLRLCYSLSLIYVYLTTDPLSWRSAEEHVVSITLIVTIILIGTIILNSLPLKLFWGSDLPPIQLSGDGTKEESIAGR